MYFKQQESSIRFSDIEADLIVTIMDATVVQSDARLLSECNLWRYP